MLELLKVIVQPVVLERNDDGEIVGERLSDPQPLYTQAQIEEFFTTLRSQLASMNAPADSPEE
jgi:hypothetical protein